MLNPGLFRIAGSAAALVLTAHSALAWNAHGHRTVTLLALDRLPAGTPAWIQEVDIRARIADQSNEADRWRSTKLIPIGHEANPEHYIDIEELAHFGLGLHELPRQRYEAFRAMVLAKAEHPERFGPADAKDPDKIKEWPGFLPWAIQEEYAKLQSSFNTYRVLEAVNDPRRATQLEQARQNIIYHMGMLSHYVGDAAQPLHTTIHHHGWKGENPRGYSTEFGIHSFIDGKIIEIHDFDHQTLRGYMPAQLPGGSDAWEIAIAAIDRSFAHVEPLYAMEKDGSIKQESGRELIAGRLCDGAATLASLYAAAWEASKPTDRDVSTFVKFSEMREPASRP
jgi:hypothetical protein